VFPLWASRETIAQRADQQTQGMRKGRESSALMMPGEYPRACHRAVSLVLCLTLACRGEPAEGRQNTAKAAISDSITAGQVSRTTPASLNSTAAPSLVVTSVCDSTAASWSSVPNARVERSNSAQMMSADGQARDHRVLACEVNASTSGGMDSVVAARLFFPSAVYGSRLPHGWYELWKLGTGMEGQETHYFQRDKIRCQVRDHTDTSDDASISRSPPFFGQDMSCWEEPNQISPADTAGCQS
jgi:hypothetical protein